MDLQMGPYTIQGILITNHFIKQGSFMHNFKNLTLEYFKFYNVSLIGNIKKLFDMYIMFIYLSN